MAASIRVLFVDDQPEVRTLASRWLAREGVEVALAETAEQALEMLESALPDVVCLDRELPGMSGMTALKEMLKRYPSLRIMLVSGDDDEQTARAARDAGARVFLAKPFERVTLFAAVRATLGAGREE
ncbi:MAG: response regulator [Polyangiaceae bacterium]